MTAIQIVTESGMPYAICPQEGSDDYYKACQVFGGVEGAIIIGQMFQAGGSNNCIGPNQGIMPLCAGPNGEGFHFDLNECNANCEQKFCKHCYFASASSSLDFEIELTGSMSNQDVENACWEGLGSAPGFQIGADYSFMEARDCLTGNVDCPCREHGTIGGAAPDLDNECSDLPPVIYWGDGCGDPCDSTFRHNGDPDVCKAMKRKASIVRQLHQNKWFNSCEEVAHDCYRDSARRGVDEPIVGGTTPYTPEADAGENLPGRGCLYCESQEVISGAKKVKAPGCTDAAGAFHPDAWPVTAAGWDGCISECCGISGPPKEHCTLGACENKCDLDTQWEVATLPESGSSAPGWESSGGSSYLKYTAVDSEDCGGAADQIQGGQAAKMFHAKEHFKLRVSMLTNHNNDPSSQLANFKLHKVNQCCTGICEPKKLKPEKCCVTVNSVTKLRDPNGDKVGKFVRYKDVDGIYNCPCGYNQQDPTKKTKIFEDPDKLIWPLEQLQSTDCIRYVDVGGATAWDGSDHTYKGHSGIDVHFYMPRYGMYGSYIPGQQDSFYEMMGNQGVVGGFMAIPHTDADWDRMRDEPAKILAARAGEVVFVWDESEDECDARTKTSQQVDPPRLNNLNEDLGAPWDVSNFSNPQEMLDYFVRHSFPGVVPWQDQVKCDQARSNGVMIRHFVNEDRSLPDYYTIYIHNQKESAMVKVGDWVEQGQEIALVGSSGGSPAPHLHFGVTSRNFDHTQQKQIEYVWSGGDFVCPYVEKLWQNPNSLPRNHSNCGWNLSISQQIIPTVSNDGTLIWDKENCSDPEGSCSDCMIDFCAQGNSDEPECRTWASCLELNGRWKCGDEPLSGGCMCECVKEKCFPSQAIYIYDSYSEGDCLEECGCGCKQNQCGKWQKWKKFELENGDCVFDTIPIEITEVPDGCDECDNWGDNGYSTLNECLNDHCGENPDCLYGYDDEADCLCEECEDEDYCKGACCECEDDGSPPPEDPPDPEDWRWACMKDPYGSPTPASSLPCEAGDDCLCAYTNDWAGAPKTFFDKDECVEACNTPVGPDGDRVYCRSSEEGPDPNNTRCSPIRDPSMGINIRAYCCNEADQIIPKEENWLPCSIKGCYPNYDCDTCYEKELWEVSMGFPGQLKADGSASIQGELIPVLDNNGNIVKKWTCPDDLYDFNAEPWYFRGWETEEECKKGGPIYGPTEDPDPRWPHLWIPDQFEPQCRWCHLGEGHCCLGYPRPPVKKSTVAAAVNFVPLTPYPRVGKKIPTSPCDFPNQAVTMGYCPEGNCPGSATGYDTPKEAVLAGIKHWTEKIPPFADGDIYNHKDWVPKGWFGLGYEQDNPALRNWPLVQMKHVYMCYAVPNDPAAGTFGYNTPKHWTQYQATNNGGWTYSIHVCPRKDNANTRLMGWPGAFSTKNLTGSDMGSGPPLAQVHSSTGYASEEECLASISSMGGELNDCTCAPEPERSEQSAELEVGWDCGASALSLDPGEVYEQVLVGGSTWHYGLPNGETRSCISCAGTQGEVFPWPCAPGRHRYRTLEECRATVVAVGDCPADAGQNIIDCCTPTGEWRPRNRGNGIDSGWICGNCGANEGRGVASSVVTHGGKCYKCTGVNASGEDADKSPDLLYGWVECDCCDPQALTSQPIERWWCVGGYADDGGTDYMSLKCLMGDPWSGGGFPGSPIVMSGGYFSETECLSECDALSGRVSAQTTIVAAADSGFTLEGLPPFPPELPIPWETLGINWLEVHRWIDEGFGEVDPPPMRNPITGGSCPCTPWPFPMPLGPVELKKTEDACRKVWCEHRGVCCGVGTTVTPLPPPAPPPPETVLPSDCHGNVWFCSPTIGCNLGIAPDNWRRGYVTKECCDLNCESETSVV
jgi:hypothetical protein